MSGFFFDCSARSAIGLVREGNEDSAYVSGSLLAVADGMGGHAGGEVASKIAIKVLQSLTPMLTNPTIDSDSIEDLLLNSLHTIDAEIEEHVREEIELRGMGTTLTVLLSHDDSIALIHVGDSRCYRLRGNTFEQLSIDHTVVQELLDQGAITETDVTTHPQRSVLTQALMGEGSVTPLMQIFDSKESDRYLLCSDGLTSVLSDKEIKNLLKENDKDVAVKALVDAAYIQGAPDNVTVIIADITRNEVKINLLFGAAL